VIFYLQLFIAYIIVYSYINNDYQVKKVKKVI